MKIFPGLALLLAAAAGAVAITYPSGGSAESSTDGLDNASATSLATVTRRALSSQTLVSCLIRTSSPK